METAIRFQQTVCHFIQKILTYCECRTKLSIKVLVTKIEVIGPKILYIGKLF